MATLKVSTDKKKQVIDITEMAEAILSENKKEISLCTIFVKHTTAAITTADLDPGTDLDMLDAFEAMMPRLRYRHPHNPAHVTDHILASIIGPSVIIPVANGSLDLGMWQRVVLIELDGPRKREVVVTLL